MSDEYSALIKNGTWVLVPRPLDVNITRCMWLFKHKFKSNGELERYKARLVVNGRSQQVGIDCTETFSPVVKPATIRTVLSLALSRDWSIYQLDVKNAFLNGHLNETVYMHQPPGFRDKSRPDHVWLFLSQKKYAQEIVQRANLSSCKASHTPVDTKSKLSANSGPPVADPLLYRSLAGALQYLTFTRPDISYAVQQICLHMHDPREEHFSALKRIIRYVKGTAEMGLTLCKSTCSKLTATIVYCDNISAIYLSGNPVNHQRTKHIEMDIHFVREKVAKGQGDGPCS
ncbi:uncharacterized protein LOC109836255 [Asparagus officinalis]|uniref:uncharacterized protein LOC109836255 n=1 Tax=Asparagus officinalis TaxID=4686 RepID=UPI00098E115B|nr:uncharacterized protein LOC109836255 [Asparagus officinalis]